MEDLRTTRAVQTPGANTVEEIGFLDGPLEALEISISTSLALAVELSYLTLEVGV